MEIEQNKMETKLLSKYENDLKNLQEKILKEMNENRDLIEKSVQNETTTKLESQGKNFRKDLRKDLLTQNDDLKKKLQETSTAFVEDVVQVKCEEIKKDLSHDLELKLNNNLANERAILMNEIQSEVKVQGEEIQLNAIQELYELTKRLQNRTCNLERRLNKKYELDKLKMEDNLKKQISSQVHCDIKSFSKGLNVLRPRPLNVIWEIQDFKKKFSNKQRSIESEVFQLDEFGCKVKFRFHWSERFFGHHLLYLEVQYLDRPTDELFPLTDYHRITFILHDQVGEKSKTDFIRVLEPTFGDWSNRTHCPLEQEMNDWSFLHSRWVKNGKTQVKMIVESLNDIIALEPHHYGHIIWKIDHFKDVCKSHQDGCQYSWSQAFYSSEKGYRMRGFLFVDDKVDFKLYFLKGPWDKELPEEFQHRTTVTLISQKDPRELKDMMISKESDSTTWDSTYGFTKTDLENYVQNDSLIICFKVDSLSL